MFNASETKIPSVNSRHHYPLDILLDPPIEKPLKTASPSVGRVGHSNFSRENIPVEAGGVGHGVTGKLPGDQPPCSVDPAAEEDSPAAPTEKHWFSRPLAVEAGISDAILLKFLSHKISRSKNLKDGKHWFYDSIPDIAGRYPYLTAPMVEEALRRSDRSGLILRGNYNRHRRDRTIWYSMPLEVRNRAEKELIGFDVADAVAFDLPTAVLLEHLRYWSGRSLADDPDSGGAFRFSPTEAARYLPLSKATIERKLRNLQERGVLKRRGKVDNVGVFALAGSWAGRVRPIAAPAKSSPTSKKFPRSTSAASVNPGVTRMTSPGSTPPVAASRWNRDRLNRLLAENKRILAGLDPQVRASTIEAVKREADRYLGALTEQKLHRTYRKLLSPDELMDQAEIDRQTPAFTIREELLTLTLERLCMIFVKNSPESFEPSYAQKAGETYHIRVTLVYRHWLAEVREETQLQFEARQREHESLDKDKEGLTEITPVEKTRVLRNGINAVNLQGFLDQDGRMQPSKLRSDVSALAAAERFFEVNPAWSAGDLIRVMVASEQLDRFPPEEDYDERWHARQGYDLRFLLINLESVLQGLNLAGKMPPVVPVAKEVLFPKPAPAGDDPDGKSPTTAPA